jgi:hypothetical protein
LKDFFEKKFVWVLVNLFHTFAAHCIYSEFFYR